MAGLTSSSNEEIKAFIAQIEAAKQDERYQFPLPAKIQRVPKHLREREELHQYSSSPAAQVIRDNDVDFDPRLRQHKVATKYFTPKMLSIGPIHHHLRLGEEHKLRWTAKHVENTNKSTMDLYQKIRGDVENLRKLFADDVIEGYDNDKLARMLLVDGCSVLYFMKHYKFENPEILRIKYDQMVHMKRDLILLENQLPYKVLLLLSSSEDELLGIMKRYIFESMYRSLISRQNQNPDHDHRRNTGNHHVVDFQEQPTHLLHHLRQIIIYHGIGRNRQENDNKLGRNLRPTYKNIRDLKAARIAVRKAKEPRDIYYSDGIIFGHLEIPEFTVNDSTAITILNVIAYEMCPDFWNKYEVTSFVEFMESVIDDAEDVKELRKAGVIVNMLGSDEEVAQLFNLFSTDLVVSSTYTSVRMKIEFQYSRKWRTWIAIFIYDHFRNPWTITAFLAAILALGLTGIQTYFTVFPRK